ncbi:Snu13p [Saccharomyces cerevisiae FostersB]|nr:Snu13p [Saccharomyces cerevisiae FostersB]
MSAPNPKAFPLADAALTQQILDVVQQAANLRQLKKGCQRSYQNFEPWYLRIHHLWLLTVNLLKSYCNLPLLCEDKNVPYVFVPSRVALGRACGVSRPVIAASITTNDASAIKTQIYAVKDKIETFINLSRLDYIYQHSFCTIYIL